MIVEVAESHLILLRKRMVQPEGKLLEILLVRSGKARTVVRITNWDMLQQLNNRRVSSACSLRCVRNGRRVSLQDIALDGLLIAAKEEGSIATVVKGRATFAKSRQKERTAKGSAKLIPLELVLPGSVPRSGIEDRVAQKLKRISVELVGTGFSDDIHHTAGVLTVLRAVVAGLHTEFLKRIRHWEWLVNIRVLVNVIAAIKLVADLVLPRSIGHDCDRTWERLGRTL